jgi:hypothetical protein
MRNNKIFRVLALFVILVLLVVAMPAKPALAQVITLTPNSGNPGTMVTVTGTGFTGYTTVYVFFEFSLVKTVSVTAGSLTSTFSVPSGATAGQKMVSVHTTPVYGGAGDTTLAFAFFTVTQSSITISPVSAYVGQSVTVSGTGFAVSTIVTVTFDNVPVSTATTTATGTFTTTVTVPESYRGSHTVKATDTSGSFNTASFITLQSITINPTEGAVGDEVTVSGKGFGANQAVTITYDGTQVTTDPASVTTSISGNFSASFSSPGGASGAHTIIASDGTYTASASFTTTASFSLDQTEGYIGDEVTFSGIGFGASQTITITYDSTQVITNPDPLIADANGSFSGGFEVPPGPAGTCTVKASDGTNIISANFTTIGDATISQITSEASPGYVGMEFAVTGVGFAPNSLVTITYTSSPVLLAQVITDENGEFSVYVTIPPSTAGEHTITVSGGDITKEFPFFMESEAPATPPLLLPAADAEVEEVTYFDWEDVSDPSGVTYVFQVSTSLSFGSTYIILEKTGLSDSEYTLTGIEKLEPNEEESFYYWRVRAIDGVSNKGDWSALGVFHVTGSVEESAFPLPDWAKYLIMAVGAVLIGLLGFWLGRRSARQSPKGNTE